MRYDYACVFVWAFGFGVLVRDVAQDYKDAQTQANLSQAMAACQRAIEKSERFAFALAQANEVGSKAGDRRRLSDQQVLTLLTDQLADRARNPAFDSALAAEISLVQRRIRCDATQEEPA